MNETELIDRYTSDLIRDPKAAPPPELDAEVAQRVQMLVLSERSTMLETSLSERIWHKALTQAEGGSDSFGSHKASSSNTTENVRYLKPGERADMEDDMYTADIYEPLNRTAPGTRPPEARYLLQYTATIAAAVLVLVVVGGVLIQMAHDPGNTGYPALVNVPTETPAPRVITAENVNQIQLLRILGRGNILDIAWSPDGKTLALASANGPIWLYEVNALDVEPRVLLGHTRQVRSLAFSPDSKRLVSGGSDLTGAVRVWDVETGTALITLDSPAVNSLVFSPDGTLVAATAGANIRIMKVETGEEMAHLSGHVSVVNSVAFSPDGKSLVSGGNDKTVRVWDVELGTQLATLEGHEQRVNSVAFSPDGKMIVSGSDDNTMRLWDWNGTIAGAQQIVLRGHTAPVLKVVFSPDSKLLASASKDKTIRLWNIQRGGEQSVLSGHTDQVQSIDFSPDGVNLASVSPDETLRLWDVTAGAEIEQITVPRGTDRVINATISHDGKMLVSGGADRTVRLWDVTTGMEKSVLRGHSGIVYGAVFSPDGATVASASEDMTIRLWDVATGETRAVLTGSPNKVVSIAFSPDGKLLASSSAENGDIWLWDGITGESRAILKGHTDTPISIAFSPDGKLLASGSADSTVRLWNVATGTEDKVLETHAGNVWIVAFSPDGKTLASAGEDRKIRLWDVATGAKIKELEGQLSLVLGLGFSPDGSLLASSAGDYDYPTLPPDLVVRLWDVATGAQLTGLEGHTQMVDGVLFSPDGTLLVSYSEDGSIRIWGLPEGGG